MYLITCEAVQAAVHPGLSSMGRYLDQDAKINSQDFEIVFLDCSDDTKV